MGPYRMIISCLFAHTQVSKDNSRIQITPLIVRSIKWLSCSSQGGQLLSAYMFIGLHMLVQYGLQ